METKKTAIKKAIIFDLDNTIYSVPEVAEDMLASLVDLIEENGGYNTSIQAIKTDMMRKPFQVLAETHGFSQDLIRKGFQHLQKMTYNKPMKPFPDYAETRKLLHNKFLVTSGFQTFQMSKIKSLGIDKDFAEIHIVDLENNTKKNVFADIIKRHQYAPKDVVVVGDDMHSEIAAARELNVDVVLYDSLNLYPYETSLPRITDFKELVQFV